MPWLSVSVETDCFHAEALADSLLEAGALSVAIEDADAGTVRETPQFGEPGSLTTPGWTRSRVTALLPPGTKAGSFVAACAAAIGISPVPSFTQTEVAEQNWVQLKKV